MCLKGTTWCVIVLKFSMDAVKFPDIVEIENYLIKFAKYYKEMMINIFLSVFCIWVFCGHEAESGR